MKIYISGQITGLTVEEFTLNFNDAYSKLFELKYVDYSGNIINPLNITPLFGIKKWLCYMLKDIFYLKKCTHIAMQPNWIESRGAIIEYFFAKFIFKLKIIWL